MLSRHKATAFFAAYLLAILAFTPSAHAAVLYSQMDQSTSTSTPIHPAIVAGEFDDDLGSFDLGSFSSSTPLYFSFIMQIHNNTSDPSSILGRQIYLYDVTDNVACQAYTFSSADQTLTNDNAFHTFASVATNQTSLDSHCYSGGIKHWKLTSYAVPENWYDNATYKANSSGHLFFMLATASTDYTDTSTRIDSVVPANGQTISSTTPVTLEASGYVNKSVADLANVEDKSGLQIQWNIYSNTQSNNCIDVICATGNGVGGVNYYSGTGYVVFGSPYFNVSTSSPALTDGYYILTTSIIKPTSYFGLTSLFGFSFGTQVIVSKQTQFIVGTTTAAQELFHNISGLANTQQLTATTTEAAMSSCNMLSWSFNLGDCLFVLFYPNLTDFTPVIKQAQNGFLTKAPMGYATRLITILTDNASTTATTTLPTIVITFPSTLPIGGSTLTFDMQDFLDSGASLMNSITDPISGLNAQQMFEPMIQLFIALTAFVIIFHDIMGMGEDSIRRNSGRGRNRSGGGDDSERYREYLYNHK